MQYGLIWLGNSRFLHLNVVFSFPHSCLPLKLLLWNLKAITFSPLLYYRINMTYCFRTTPPAPNRLIIGFSGLSNITWSFGAGCDSYAQLSLIFSQMFPNLNIETTLPLLKWWLCSLFCKGDGNRLVLVSPKGKLEYYSNHLKILVVIWAVDKYFLCLSDEVLRGWNTCSLVQTLIDGWICFTFIIWIFK